MICYRKGFKGLRISLNRRRREYFREQLVDLNMGLESRMKDNVKLLSGGQRQALTLLMMVLSRPALILLDEHTAALDPKNAAVVLDLTRKYVEEYRLTTMMITHNMQHAIDYGNRLLMMDNGEVILDVSGEEKSRLDGRGPGGSVPSHTESRTGKRRGAPQLNAPGAGPLVGWPAGSAYLYGKMRQSLHEQGTVQHNAPNFTRRNGMRNKIVVFFVAMVLAASVAWAAGQGEEGPIKIGVAGAHSGDLASYGLPTVNAAELVANQINENGGLLGRQIELVVEDDQCQPEVATNTAAKLVGDGVVAVIGHICSGATPLGPRYLHRRADRHDFALRDQPRADAER